MSLEKVKPIVEQFSFEFHRMEQNQQLALIAQLSKENAALNQRVSDLESAMKKQLAMIGNGTFGYYDFDFMSKELKGDFKNQNGYRVVKREANNLGDGLYHYFHNISLCQEVGKYVYEHPRFKSFQSLFSVVPEERSFGMTFEFKSRTASNSGSADAIDPRCSDYGLSGEELEFNQFIIYTYEGIGSILYLYPFDTDRNTKNKKILNVFRTNYETVVKK